MSITSALLLLALASGPESGKWELKAKEDGVSVFSRERAGSRLPELKAIGLIDAPPAEVWKTISDYANYKKNMPYTEESKVLSTEQDGKVTLFYSVINAPFVSRRDYIIRLVDESDGSGTYKVSWTPVKEGPPPKDGVVRVLINDGYWLLEPRDNGTKTFATYYLHTDPGGSIPRWIANKANDTAVPNVFRSVRKVVSKK